MKISEASGGFKSAIKKSNDKRLTALKKAKRDVEQGMSPEAAIKKYDLFPTDIAKLKEDKPMFKRKPMVNEAVAQDDRYVRTWGIRPNKKTKAQWMFTTKRMGGFDMKNPKEFYSHPEFTTVELAAREAKKHFQKHNPKEFFSVYVAEELDENLAPDFENSRSLDNPELRTEVQTKLDTIAQTGYATPYIALHKVRKILASHNIFMTDELVRLPDLTGEYYFQVYQFGTDKTYKADSGEILDQDDIGPEMFLYVSIENTRLGYFEVSVSLVDGEQLSGIIGDDSIQDF